MGVTSIGHVLDLGLEFPPTAVSPTSSKLSDLYTFPNPSGGLFTLGFNAQSQLSVVRLKAFNMAGHCVYSKAYKEPTSSFAENIDMRGQPRGIYLLQVEAAGEVLSRQVQVE